MDGAPEICGGIDLCGVEELRAVATVGNFETDALGDAGNGGADCGNERVMF